MVSPRKLTLGTLTLGTLTLGTLTLGRALLVTAAALLTSAPAFADFHLCNKTDSRIGVAIGYKDGDLGWVTEGWWNLAAGSCDTLWKGALAARYYIHAIDYDRGGEWSGQAFMCTRDKEFTIVGTDDCVARGLERTGFIEIDTSRTRSEAPGIRTDSDNPNDFRATLVAKP